MAAKHRIRVCIGHAQDGSAIMKQLSASSEVELADRIVRAILSSERRAEFVPDAPQRIVRFTPPETSASPLLKDYAWQWFYTFKEKSLKPTTVGAYTINLRHICNALGEQAMDAVTTADIQLFLNAHQDKARSYLIEMRRIIQAVYQAAQEDGWVTNNPAASKRITIPSQKKKARQALSQQQLCEIAKHLPELEDRDRRYLALLMFTGMRKGEALGLRWEDIDPQAMEIHIRRNVTYPQGANDPYIGTPKTQKGTRTIPMAQQLLSLLSPLEQTGFVIGGGDKPITKMVELRMFQRIGRKVDLYGATAHVFRHTYATLLNASGAAPKTIQGILGHADITTTMNLYVHQDAKLAHQAAEAVSQAIAR